MCGGGGGGGGEGSWGVCVTLYFRVLIYTVLKIWL